MTTAMDEMREMNRSLAEIGGFVRERGCAERRDEGAGRGEREQVIFEAMSGGGGGESTGGGDLGETRRRMGKMADHARRSRG